MAWALVSFAVRLHLCIFDSVLYKGTWISESLLSLACCSVVTSVFTTDYRCSHKRNEFFKCTNNHSHSSNCIPIQHWLIFLFAIANTHTHTRQKRPICNYADWLLRILHARRTTETSHLIERCCLLFATLQLYIKKNLPFELVAIPFCHDLYALYCCNSLFRCFVRDFPIHRIDAWTSTTATTTSGKKPTQRKERSRFVFNTESIRERERARTMDLSM